MKQLKNKLFEVLSRTLSIKEFEAWLYTDTYVNEHILEDERVLELLSINLKSAHAMAALNSFCFEYFAFDKEECLVAIVEFNCQKFLQNQGENSAQNMISNIGSHHDWDDNYTLIAQAYWYGDEWDLANDGYYSKRDVMHNLTEFAQTVLNKLSNASKEERKQLLIEGIEEKRHNIYPSNKELNQKPRKWFQFWKQ